MDKVRYGQVSPVVKKGKKKQPKGEVHCQKQAEKKKRRLEKALATSAAIRSELEKKKQKKIEEQQRLDEEGAAIAESVALHVLGEESHESCQFMMSNAATQNWNYSGNINFYMGYQSSAKYSSDGLGWTTDSSDSAWKWNSSGIGLSLPAKFYVNNLQSPYSYWTNGGVDLSAGLLAAEAVSSLQIAEDSDCAQFAINKMLGSSNVGKKLEN
ncbi:hypothetical protein Cni_G27052 [Canna indica]|uniref:Uncharacterized protein n=1 Tax=Canna indica TaxID=4628 RepID=A0AAQ3L0I6_9LILI|nr:hypothetical protein Cni_G27052 [Canna indica]